MKGERKRLGKRFKFIRKRACLMTANRGCQVQPCNNKQLTLGGAERTQKRAEHAARHTAILEMLLSPPCPAAGGRRHPRPEEKDSAPGSQSALAVYERTTYKMLGQINMLFPSFTHSPPAGLRL